MRLALLAVHMVTSDGRSARSRELPRDEPQLGIVPSGLDSHRTPALEHPQVMAQPPSADTRQFAASRHRANRGTRMGSQVGEDSGFAFAILASLLVLPLALFVLNKLSFRLYGNVPAVVVVPLGDRDAERAAGLQATPRGPQPQHASPLGFVVGFRAVQRNPLAGVIRDRRVADITQFQRTTGTVGLHARAITARMVHQDQGAVRLAANVSRFQNHLAGHGHIGEFLAGGADGHAQRIDEDHVQALVSDAFAKPL